MDGFILETHLLKVITPVFNEENNDENDSFYYVENYDFVILEEHPEVVYLFSHLAFETEKRYFDYGTEFEKLGYTEDDLEFGDFKLDDNGTPVFTYINKDFIEVYIINPKILTKKQMAIKLEYYDYLRYGENVYFIKDNVKIHPYIVDYNSLINRRDRYFSGDDLNYNKTRRVIFEKTYFEMNDERKEFNEKILNKFIEGKTLVRHEIYC